MSIPPRYLDTPLTFVNSHLAAFVPNSAERNAQFRSTTSQLLFPPTGEESEHHNDWSLNLRPTEARPAGNGSTVWDCEALFWMGDLNVSVIVTPLRSRMAKPDLERASKYRLDAQREDIDVLIRHRDHAALLAFDQVRRSCRKSLHPAGF